MLNPGHHLDPGAGVLALLPDLAVAGELIDGALVALPLHSPPLELVLLVVRRDGEERCELREAIYAIAG
jgi:hypothetical protein